MSNDDISLIPMNTPLVQEGEEDPNEPNGFTTRTYRRRFYVVFVVSLIAFAQSWIWNGWGPIQRPVEQVFGWTDSTIALLANWGPIAYVLSVVFWTWLMGKNLRLSLVLTALLIAAGSGLRCCSMEPTAATWLNHFGLFLNGLATPVAMSAPPLISAYWFPPTQRTTATALSSMAPYYGVSFSFAIGPVMVPDHNATNVNITSSWKSCNLTQQNLTDCQIHVWTKEIRRYQLMEFIAASAIFLLALIYLPSKPPIPPSKTASVARIRYLDGLKKLLRHRQFWLVCSAYGISLGILAGWNSVLAVNLKYFGIGERDAGWIGFYANVAGSVAALVVSGLADCIGRRTKTILIVMLCGATFSFLWFTLLCLHIFPKSTVSLYISATLGGLFLNGSIPLFYELAVEATYPIEEATTTGMLLLMNNLYNIVVLLLLLIKYSEKNIRYWMNPSVVAACGICIPFMVLFKARYTRLSVDLPSERKDSISEA